MCCASSISTTTTPFPSFHQPQRGGPYPAQGNALGPQAIRKTKALKGRPKPCPNPSHASTSISSSAPKIANASSPIKFVIPSTPTWPPSCKTLAVHPCSSIPSKITRTSCSSWLAPCLLAQPWKRSKKHPPNGSKPRGQHSRDFHGRQVMERSPCPNPTCWPSVNTSRINRNIIAGNHFRRNTGLFWNDTKSPSMNGMFGIDSVGWGAPSFPRRCPGLKWICPVGAREGGASKVPSQTLCKAPTGRTHTSKPRATPWVYDHPHHQSPEGAAQRAGSLGSSAPSGLGFNVTPYHPGRQPGLIGCCPVGAREASASKVLSPTLCKAPKGRLYQSPGQRPGFTTIPIIKALKGRHNVRGPWIRAPLQGSDLARKLHKKMSLVV